MTDNLQQKFDNLYTLIKPSNNIKNFTTFVLLKDHTGWTDLFFVDLKGLNIEEMKAQALLKKSKLELYNIDIEKCPDIAPILTKVANCTYTCIDNIEYDLLTNSIALLADKAKINVNAKYLGYFEKTYANFGKLSYQVCTQHAREAVIVMLDTDFIGLIMPMNV